MSMTQAASMRPHCMLAITSFVLCLALSSGQVPAKAEAMSGADTIQAFEVDAAAASKQGTDQAPLISPAQMDELTKKILLDVSVAEPPSKKAGPDSMDTIIADLHRVESRVREVYGAPSLVDVQTEQNTKSLLHMPNWTQVKHSANAFLNELPHFFLLDKTSSVGDESVPTLKSETDSCGHPISQTWLHMFNDGKASEGVVIVSMIFFVVAVLAVPILYFNSSCRVLKVRSPWCICLAACVGMNAMILVGVPHMMPNVSAATMQRCLHVMHFVGLPLLIGVQYFRVCRFRALYRYECDKLQIGGKQPILSRLLEKNAQPDAVSSEQTLLDGMIERKEALTEQKCIKRFVYLTLGCTVYTLFWCTLWSCNLRGPGMAVVTIVHDLVLVLFIVHKVRPMSRVVESFGFKRELYCFNVVCVLFVIAEIIMFIVDQRKSDSGSVYNFMLFAQYHLGWAIFISLVALLIIFSALENWWHTMRDMYVSLKHDSQKMLNSFADFDTVMYFPAYRKYFFLYLSSEFLSEYALFWRDVKEFRKLVVADHDVNEAARAMYDLYIQEDGALCLMLDDDQRLRIAHGLFSSQRNVGCNAFQAAEDAVYQRMCTLLPRFIKSPFAKVCAHQLGQIKPDKSTLL